MVLQNSPTPGFFETWQFDRAYTFLQVMTERIHSNNAYRTTGMLEVLNEPARGHTNLLDYYKTALAKVRETEAKLNIGADKALTVQFMANSWGAGNPKSVIGDAPNVAYDDHRYLKWANVEQSKQSYIATSCSDSFGSEGNNPIMIGEWSLAVDDNQEKNPDWTPDNEANKAFYTQWWAAQVQTFEKGLGWAFWSWKTQLGNDWRWSYSAAVEAGVIPKDPSQAAQLARC
jgi:aryl-phospho-beta-D-glucosidase BglC (GH1 family)